jgi:hypothetical protein
MSAHCLPRCGWQVERTLARQGLGASQGSVGSTRSISAPRQSVTTERPTVATTNKKGPQLTMTVN